MSRTRILVVDPDPSTIRGVQRALPPEKYELALAADGAEGLRVAAATPPGLILLEVNLARMDGLTFLRTLRAQPEFALVPAIFLAPRAVVEPRMLGFKIGADDFLPKPVDLGALESRITEALLRGEAAQETVRPEAMPTGEWSVQLAGFRGTLDQIGLPSLLSILEMERKTGILVLILEPEQEKIRLYLSEGRVLRARVDKKEEPRNAELVYRLLARTRGKFDFRPAGVLQEDEIQSSTTRLILEGARRIDESQRRS
jgi:DNA-binding response OmpR family regulator